MTQAVVITGAGRGLGRSAALALLGAGYAVIGTTSSHPDDADEVAKAAGDAASRLQFLHLDVTDVEGFTGFRDQVRARLDAMGEEHLHALVNNAGVGVLEGYASTTTAQFDLNMTVNARGPYFLTQAMLPLLTSGSRVVTMTTALTRSVVPGGSAYAMSKGAVEVMTRYLAVELAGSGIRVNAVMGGAVDTGFGDGAMRTPAVQEAAEASIAWGRVARPDDIEGVMPLILAPGFQWATGGIVDMTGGQGI